MVQFGNQPEVPQFQVFLAALFGLACIIAFLFLIDYAAKLLRPVSLVHRVAAQGIAVIESVYPYPTRDLAVPVCSAPAKKHQLEFVSWESHGAAINAAPTVTGGSPDRVIYTRANLESCWP